MRHEQTADICEDKLLYLCEKIKYFDNHPIDFEGAFNEQIANEFNCRAKAEDWLKKYDT